jgi:hypothetical protein
MGLMESDWIDAKLFKFAPEEGNSTYIIIMQNNAGEK